jgi:hypothetical protein
LRKVNAEGQRIQETEFEREREKRDLQSLKKIITRERKRKRKEKEKRTHPKERVSKRDRVPSSTLKLPSVHPTGSSDLRTRA